MLKSRLLSQAAAAAKGLPRKWPIPGVKHVVVVSSAKGGVGKSTTAVNLALGMSVVKPGCQVGILDADVFGPSIPKMMNLSGLPNISANKLMLPLINYGIKCMSMGFLVDDKDAIVWRGLMVMSGIEKLLRGVSWGNLDVLVIDMPPGTGDTQLSISQNIPISGALIVSTPQDIALLDAVRFKSIGVLSIHLNISKGDQDVPIFGIVQNMSQYVCPNCQHVSHIFGQDGCYAAGADLGIDVIADIPLTLETRLSCDQGRPIVISHPDSPPALAYKDLASKILAKLQVP